MISTSRSRLASACLLAAIGCAPVAAQTPAPAPTPTPASASTAAAPDDSVADPIVAMVSRLNLESYKATVKGLTKFGDRRQGTDRNRAAIDWIEAQLKSYGCTPTERITYDYQPPAPRPGAPNAYPPRVPSRPPGGGRFRGTLQPTGVNTDSLAQPDATLRALDRQPSQAGERQEVYCTKVGTTHPDEMYIVGGHMDGIGWGEAANDDGSGTAVVMELARVFSAPDVKTDRSIRFILWNNEDDDATNASRLSLLVTLPLNTQKLGQFVNRLDPSMCLPVLRSIRIVQ